MFSYLKSLIQSRPASEHDDGETPMEVDGNNLYAAPISHHNQNGLFSNVNGSASVVRTETPGTSNGRGIVLTAGMNVGSPATRRRGGPMGASVTRVIRSGEGPYQHTVSTTVVRPSSGGANGTSVRPNYSTRPGACDNFTDDVLGVITIGDFKDEEGSHRNQNGTAGQKEEISNGCAGTPKPHHLPDMVPQKPVIPDPPFQIFIRNVNGKTYTITVRKGDTVDFLLEEVHKRINVYPDQFWLNYAGRRLRRGETMKDCNVQKECTIYVEMRLRGG